MGTQVSLHTDRDQPLDLHYAFITMLKMTCNRLRFISSRHPASGGTCRSRSCIRHKGMQTLDVQGLADLPCSATQQAIV